MKRPANIDFLTTEENMCMEYLLMAQDIFDKICSDSPQNPGDSYNFGHYVDAARNAILVRGCRRMDPENLMKRDPKSHAAEVTPTMAEHARSSEGGAGKLGEILDTLNRGENPAPPNDKEG